MAPRILIVLTSQSTIPATNEPTGWFLVRVPHNVIRDVMCSDHDCDLA